MGSKTDKKHKSKLQSNKKPRKMRKSSFNKVKKHFEVFNSSNENINRYADLPVEEDADKQSSKENTNVPNSSDDDVYDPATLNLDMDDYEDDEDDDDKNAEASPTVAAATKQDGEPVKKEGDNAVEDNNDFIGFEDSSTDEDGNNSDDNDDNDEEEEEEKEETPRVVNSDYPWILNHDHSTQQEVIDWLCLEIRDFVAYVSPSRSEIESRNRTISKLRSAVKEFWPDADLLIFGSYATDLYLPGSDIDCVINSKHKDKDSRQALYSLSTFLKRKGLAQQMEVIANARVPIIKFVDPDSLLHIDVSFERTNGVEAANLIRSWLEEQRGLRELVLIVKQFLHARKLNSVYNGGLGGFTTICLVYSFLKLHPKILSNEIEPLDNLGVLLIDFFELYGKNFAYDDIGISLNDGSNKGAPFGYFRKKDYPELLRLERNTFTLCIQDPGDPTNNISRSSYNIRGIKKAFSGAFDLLTNRCYELYAASYKNRRGQSILGNVIKYRGKLREFKDERSLVVNRAIKENEQYIKRKRTIVKVRRSSVDEDGTYLSENYTATSEEEEDQYHIEEPPKKKVKKTVTRNITRRSSVSKAQVSPSKSKATSKQNSTKINDIMGLDKEDANKDSDEKDGYLPYGPPSNKEFETDSDEESKQKEDDSYEPTKAIPLRKQPKQQGKVDKKTKSEYWSNKGTSMSPLPY